MTDSTKDEDEDDAADPDAVDLVRASFQVTSEKLTADEVTEILGMQPDRQWSIGDLRKQHEHLPPARSRHTFTRWQVCSTLPNTDDLDDHLAQLWDRAAGSLERAVHLSDEVVRYLDIVRYYDGRAFQSHGINIPRRWIGLLGRIGAEVDMDQYVLRDGPDDDWPNP